ncbi:unnamed protein product [Schistosoma curassoni]|uniref:Ras-related protein Rab-4A n=1 Tax=Schistosoma curassoni TaxID=6186 RepID=A0A183JYC3_9TREM|nr:unnamed protein product [Schistosoma curassoni]
MGIKSLSRAWNNLLPNRHPLSALIVDGQLQCKIYRSTRVRTILLAVILLSTAPGNRLGKLITVISILIKGQERFRSVARSYYHDAVGALLVYDITSRDSFNELASWLSDARTLASPDIMIVLVGNKKDLQDSDGHVTNWEASAFAQDNDLHFLETSALTGENVEEAFIQCVRKLVFKIRNGELDPDRLKCNRHSSSLTFMEHSKFNSIPQVHVQNNDSTLSYECNC